MSREIYTREGDATLRRTLLTPSSYRMNARGIKNEYYRWDIIHI
jgi:hypothetical protein